jgi:hypothetical protein
MPSTVRPDPSTLGAVGERGSDREDCLQSVPGRLASTVVRKFSLTGWEGVMSPAPNLVGMPKSAAYEIELGGDERAELEHRAARYTLSFRQVRRCACGVTDRDRVAVSRLKGAARGR